MNLIVNWMCKLTFFRNSIYLVLFIKNFESLISLIIEIYVKQWCGYQVKIQGQNEEMLSTACEQFLGKSEEEIHNIALVTLEGHQRAIMGSMTVEVS